MTGSGKGVLRIAIEDFFTTTKIGLWIASYFKDIIESHENSILEEYKELFDQLVKVPGLDDVLHITKIRNEIGKHQGGITSLLGFGLGIGQQIGGSAITAMLSGLTYDANRKWKPARFPPAAAMSVLWRDPTAAMPMIGAIADQGWSEEDIKRWALILTPKPDIGTLLIYWKRGLYTASELSVELKARGWEDKSIKILTDLTDVIPGVTDLISMAVREAWDEDIVRRFEYDANLPPEAAAWAAKQGLSPEWFKRYWRAHWQLPSVQLGYEMLHRLRPGESKNPFTVDDMRTLLRTADYPTFFRERMIDVSYSPYTRVDVRRMHKLGVISDAELLAAYKDLGYDEIHAAKLADWTIKNETTTEKTKIEVARDLNQGTIVDAYQKKVIDRAKAVQLLTGLKFDQQEVEIILKAAEFQKIVANKTDLVKSYNDKMRGEIVQAYASRMLSKDEATSMLTKLGYASDETTYVIQFADFDYSMSVLNGVLKAIGSAYINGSMSQTEVITMLGKYNISGAQQTQLFSEWDVQRTVKNNRLSLAQYTTAWKRTLITDVDFRLILADLGYTAKDIDLYIKIQTPEVTIAP